MSEPWDHAGSIREPNWFEKIIIGLMVIASALFFRPPKKRK